MYPPQINRIVPGYDPSNAAPLNTRQMRRARCARSF